MVLLYQRRSNQKREVKKQLLSRYCSRSSHRIRVRILRVLENDRYEVGWIASETSGAEEEYCDTTVEGMDTLE